MQMFVGGEKWRGNSEHGDVRSCTLGCIKMKLGWFLYAAYSKLHIAASNRRNAGCVCDNGRGLQPD